MKALYHKFEYRWQDNKTLRKNIMFRQLLLLLAISMTLISCDPGFAVILNNNSAKERYVTVSKVPRQELASRDSMTIGDTSHLDFFSDKTKRQNIVLTRKDTLNNSYSFVLGKGKRALLQGGMGGPDLNQKLEIDNYDTISLKQDKRTIMHKKFMYTFVSTTIQ